MEDSDGAFAPYHLHGGVAPPSGGRGGSNGLFSSPSHPHPPPNQPPPSSDGFSTIHFPHSGVSGRATAAPPPVTSLETFKRKRGRPRKYGTPAAVAPPPASSSVGNVLVQSPSSSSGKKAAGGSPLSSPSSAARKKEGAASKKARMDALGTAGRGFTPYRINVEVGEDVAQKIMAFMQQFKRALCILSASGSVRNISLRQQTTMGGIMLYEGLFEIVTLTGSFLHVEVGGTSTRSGGLSICLAGTDGRMIGGGVAGPLKAASPVQVIVASFLLNSDKEGLVSPKTAELSNSEPPVAPDQLGSPLLQSGHLRSSTDSPGRILPTRGVDDNQFFVGGNNFMQHSQAMNVPMWSPSDWRGRDFGSYRSQDDEDDQNID